MPPPAVAEESRERVSRLLEEQAQWCERLGSHLYRYLLHRVAEDVKSGGPGWSILARHAQDSEGSALPLRLMGAVHRLVLDGRAPLLTRYYPSVGGSPGPGA